jgi:hypothetical protein
VNIELTVTRLSSTSSANLQYRSHGIDVPDNAAVMSSVREITPRTTRSTQVFFRRLLAGSGSLVLADTRLVGWVVTGTIYCWG